LNLTRDRITTFEIFVHQKAYSGYFLIQSQENKKSLASVTFFDDEWSFSYEDNRVNTFFRSPGQENPTEGSLSS